MMVRLKCIKVIRGYFSFIKINSLSSHFIKGNFGIKENKFKKGVTEDSKEMISFSVATKDHLEILSLTILSHETPLKYSHSMTLLFC